MKPLAASSCCRLSIDWRLPRLACVCRTDCSATGRSTSISCRCRASACTTATSAWRISARCSEASSSISTCSERTVWPSATGTRSTSPVICEATSTRCGVWTRPLATTVFTKSRRPIASASTLMPPHQRQPSTAATSSTPISTVKRIQRCRFGTNTDSVMRFPVESGVAATGGAPFTPRMREASPTHSDQSQAIDDSRRVVALGRAGAVGRHT